MAEEITFEVRSSSGQGNYRLRAYRTGHGTRFSCECAAGENGQICKHRLGLLTGDFRMLERGRTQDIEVVRTWFFGSGLQETIAEISRLEHEMQKMKGHIAEAKKQIARIMMG
jgi:hypothetical protein